MKNSTIDLRLIFGLIIAHVFMYITFQDKAIFWYMFTATMLILISYSISNEKIENQTSFIINLFYGTLSGIILYLLFWIGNYLIELFNLPFSKEITKLYKSFSPSQIWHYVVLLLIIVPGEELFWRSFVQKRLSNHMGTILSITVAALLYTTIQMYSGSFIHLFSALFAGVFWGALYAWKKSIPLIIISHLIFDLALFILFPLR